MRRVRLGRTGATVSAVGLGTWSYGGPLEVGGRGEGWTGHDDDRARSALARAHQAGIDHWDTADVYGYGRAEKLVGSMWTVVPRDEVFLASKVGFVPGPSGHGYEPAQMRAQLEASLARLGTDHLDCYYLHHCDFGPGDEYLDGAVAAMEGFRARGLVRFVGLSDWSCERLERHVAAVDPDVVQVYRNVRDDGYAGSRLEEWVRRHDAGVVFFSPLKHGALLGKHRMAPAYGRGDVRAHVPELQDAAALAELREAAAALADRFASHPQPVLHGLVGVLLQDAPSASVLIGMRDADQVAAAATVGGPLSAAEAAEVRRWYRRPATAAARRGRRSARPASR